MESEASESFKKAFEIDNPFNHLNTDYLQTKYFCEHMGLVVSSKFLLIVLIINSVIYRSPRK